MSDNLTLWEAVRTVDPKYTKDVNVSGKQPFTNIDAYYLIETATKHFGTYGKGFGLRDVTIDEVTLGGTVLAKLHGEFYYPGGSFPVFNALKILYPAKGGYTKIDEDAYKKIITNTLSKALSYLGFGADVYMGRFEDAGYVQEVTQMFIKEECNGYLETIRHYIQIADHPDKVTAWVLERGRAERIETLGCEEAKEITKLINQKTKRARHETAGD